MNPGRAFAQFEIARAMPDADWDSFLAGCPHAHHEQSSGWARVKRRQGWDYYRILIRAGGELIGGAQVLHRRVRGLASIGYVVYGPVARNAGQADVVMQQLIAGLKEASYTYLVILPGFGCSELGPTMNAGGFFPKPTLLPPANLATATLLLDLAPELEAIFAGMRRSTRKGIRKGLKEGLEVGLGGEEDLDHAHQLMCQLCARRGTAPEPPQARDFHDIWKEMAPAGMAKLFLARYRGEIVSSIFAFAFGDTLRAWKGGWSGRCEELYPNHVICWEAIKWAKLSGLRYFDFVQILPEHAKAVQRGETVDDSYWGVTHFKLGFGGDIAIIPDAYYRSGNAAAQLLLQLGGARVLGSARALGLITRFSSSAGPDA